MLDTYGSTLILEDDNVTVELTFCNCLKTSLFITLTDEPEQMMNESATCLT